MESKSNQPAQASPEIPPGVPVALLDLVQYQGGSIVSRAIHKSQSGTISAFAFDKGEGLSEHTAPYDAFVVVLDGSARLTVGPEQVAASAGQIVRMPANVPHSVQASDRFKMLLVMVRGT